ncbi:hypothetical protein BKH42_03495 [Helicobacter sp. 13S00482-2]|uniref:hypothetical protein n=1 Tax=Helicobacter sp. 13S00482-2 TaxID=1476200 RepID=UPI000BA4F798|nr:hypothetical protein [Helicobacter sp. 13S00482-2]PAF53805.1 hypothetical protein BKH42_03495 [Helicobacter sp. 13S00482-2]
MIDKINFVETKKVDYSEILQVSELFYRNRMPITMFNAMAYMVNFSIDEKKKDGNAFPMIIHTGVYEAINIEFNLFIKALSMNFTRETQSKFLLDFSISEGIREANNMKAPLFLCNSILRTYCKLCTEAKSYSFEKNGGVYNVANFYVPVIYEKDGIAKQMSAITVKLNSLIELISDVQNSGVLYSALEYCYGAIVEYKQVAFGVRQCNEYWIKNNRHKTVLYKAFV